MAYFGVDASYRTSLYSDASDSKYLRIDGYSLLNVRVGYIRPDPGRLHFGSKNLFDTDYFHI